MKFNGQNISKLFFNGIECQEGYFNGVKVFGGAVKNKLTLGNWYDYNNNAHVEGDIAGENVEMYMYNYSGYTGASGLARDLKVEGTVSINILLNCLTYEGAPINYQVMIYKGNTLHSRHPYQFDSKGSAMLLDIQEELTQGDYTLVIGNNTGAGFEFNIQGSSIIQNEQMPVGYTPTHKNSMWCWNDNDVYRVDDLIRVCERVNADCIYQGYSQSLDDSFDDYVIELNAHNLDVWLVFGSASWYDKPDIVKQCVNNVKIYNNAYDDRVKGIVFDIEPHLAKDDVDVQDRINMFIQTAKQVYLYAKGYGTNIIWCVPSWFNLNQLAHLIKYGDGIALMNYTKTQKIERFDLEGRLCMNKTKFIEDISEFQEPGQWDLTEDQTFYNQGLDGSLSYWEEIKEHIDNYEHFSTSYHFFDVCLELLNKEAQLAGGFNLYDYVNLDDIITSNGVTFTIKEDNKVNVNCANNTGTGRLLLCGAWTNTTPVVDFNPDKTYRIACLGKKESNIKMMCKTITSGGMLQTTAIQGGTEATITGKIGLTYLTLDILAESTVNSDYQLIIEEI